MGEARERGVGTQHAAGGVDRRDRHRGRIENAGEAHFGRAQVFALDLARGAVDHQRAGGARRPVAGKGDFVENARRQQAALTRLEVDVELLGRHFAGRAGDHGEHRAAVSGHDIVDLEPADAELSEIVVEPAGQGGVHMRDRAIRLGREKPSRRVIEIVDRVLEILEEGFMPGVVARLIRDRPRHQAVLGDALERANANAIPGGVGLAARRRRETKLLARAPAGFRRLRQAIKGFRDVRRASEQTFDRTQVGRRRRARKRAVGVIGVDDARFAVGDQDSVRIGVGDRLGGVEARRTGWKLQQAEGEQQQSESAANGKDDDHPGHQRRADRARREPQGEERAGETDEQNRQRDRIDGALNSVHRWRRRRFHLRIVTPKDIAVGHERIRTGPSRHRALLSWAACDVLAAGLKLGRKQGGRPSFQRDRVLLWMSYGRASIFGLGRPAPDSFSAAGDPARSGASQTAVRQANLKNGLSRSWRKSWIGHAVVE